jgi:hypothetical protein
MPPTHQSQAQPPVPGANSPTFSVKPDAAFRSSPAVLAGVGGVPQTLDAHIRPLTSLSPEEIADLARNAADNGAAADEANAYERGTWQWELFIREWFQRRCELVAVEA